jgi:glucokinase
MKRAIGIDIGGTNTKLGLVHEDGTTLFFEKFPTVSESGFEDFCERVLSHTTKLLKEHNLSLKDLSGIGVGAPNGNSITGNIENPPNLKWGNVDFVNQFKKLFQLENVALENDANVAALGEGKWGVAKESHNFIVVTLGTGVGTGIVLNNQLVRGSHGLSGEGGHIVVMQTNGRPCNCGGKGHLENYASVRGIKTTTYTTLEKELSFAEISDRFHRGDEVIRDIIKKSSKHLAFGLSQMGSLLAPDMFVLAGGVATLGEDLRSWTDDFYKEMVYPPFKDKTTIELSSISTAEGAVLGAASLVL